MMELVSIRAFEPEDIGAVIDLLQDVSNYLPAADTITALAEAFVTQSDCLACVATHDGRLIGFGSLFVLNRVRGGRAGIIEDVVVAADLRGLGVGRQIVDALLSGARARGCFKVSLEAGISAQQFYCAAGFAKVGQVMRLVF